MILDLKLREGKFSSECLITDVTPSHVQVDPFKQVEVTLELFPKVCGVVKISGLELGDEKKLYDFYNQAFSQITCEYWLKI